MKFIIGFLVTIGLLIVVFILIFRGGGNDAAVQTEKKMTEYANSSTVVSLTTEGPVNANQIHKQIKVSVSSTETTVEVFQGYEQNLLSTKSYANNTAAYSDFLRALDINGFDNGDKDKALADERGYCATGTRYVMSIKDGDRDIQRFWTSSCGTGTFKGKTSIIRSLFVAQVPDYNAQTIEYNRL